MATRKTATRSARKVSSFTTLPVGLAETSPTAPGHPVVGTPAGDTPTTAGPVSPQGPSASASATAHGPATQAAEPPAGQPPATASAATPTGGTAVGSGGSTPRGASSRSRRVQITNLQRKPRGNQPALAASAAAEIRRAAASGVYRTYFGLHAPDPETFATELEQAGTLSLEETRESARLTTLRTERNQAWDQVLSGSVATFQPLFDVAVAHDDTIAPAFASTAMFLRTGSDISNRSAATRKAKKSSGTPTSGGSAG